MLCDETTDISTVEQLTVGICVRYVNVPHCVIREDFIGFYRNGINNRHCYCNCITKLIRKYGSHFLKS